MNMDKVKIVRIVTLVIFLAGVINRVSSHYGYGFPESELSFWSDIVSIVAGAVFGITIEANTIKALFSGKSGV